MALSRRGCVFLVVTAVVAGCAAPTLTQEEEGTTSSAQKLVSRREVMARAQEWVDAKVPYCGGVRGGNDVLCGGTCRRPAAAWDRYRSDCSGYVSWVWQIPDDPTTYAYIEDRGGDDGWHTVAIDELQPGDALVSQTHIKLFSKRNGDAMEIYEESDCGLVARIRTQGISRIDGTRFRFAGDGRTYHGIRRAGISSAGGTAPEDSVGEGAQTFLTRGEQHHFARAASGELTHSFWDPNEGKVHRDVWGSGLAGEPTTLVAGAEQHAFARGGEGALEHWYWDRTTGKLSHDTWGTGLASDPAVILMGGGQHAFAVDGAGKLQHWYWVAGKPVQHDTWGGGIEGRPTVLDIAPEQHVFARGTDGSLEHFWWDVAKGVQHDSWGSAIASVPAAHAFNGDQHVFAIDAAGKLQHWWWGKTTKLVSHDTWSGADVDPRSRPSLLAHGRDQHVFVRGKSGSLEHYVWSPNVGVRHDTWGTGIATDPSALLVGDDEHVFANDPSGRLQHWWWSRATGIEHDQW